MLVLASDMAINGDRNKPFGPGGSTRHLHQMLLFLASGGQLTPKASSAGGEPGSTRA